MVQELSQQWPNVCCYNASTSQWQKFQIIKAHTSVILAFQLGISSSNVYSATCSFQPQGIDSYITGDFHFLSRLELFQSILQILQDIHQKFGVYGANRCAQGFFLFGQQLDFFYRLLRRINSKSNLPSEENRDSIHCLNFTGCSFLVVSNFLKKSHFGTAALRVMKTSVDVERLNPKSKTSSQVVTASVVNETFTPYFESARNYMKFVCEGLSAPCLWKSDLVKSFDLSVLFLLSKEQAASCYGCFLGDLVP